MGEMSWRKKPKKLQKDELTAIKEKKESLLQGVRHKFTCGKISREYRCLFFQRSLLSPAWRRRCSSAIFSTPSCFFFSFCFVSSFFPRAVARRCFSLSLQHSTVNTDGVGKPATSRDMFHWLTQNHSADCRRPIAGGVGGGKGVFVGDWF